MATMVNQFGSVFMSRPFATEALRWTNLGATFATDNQGHNGERVLNGPIASYRSFTASTFAMGMQEARGVIGVGGSRTMIFKFRNGNGSGGTNLVASLECDANGALYVFTGGTQMGVTTNNFVSSNTAFHTFEMGWANTAGLASCEVRMDGLRVAALTTTDFGAVTGQVAGTMTRIASAASGAVLVNVELGDTGGVAQTVVYWYWQKWGSSLWTTVKTGTTFALDSDFIGPCPRAWIFPSTTVGATYPIANWTNAAGTFPSNVADNPGGTDGDTTRISNGINGTSVNADKVSALCSQLPGTATSVRAVSRTIIARLTGGTSTIRTGLRNAGADAMDADAVLTASYAAYDIAYPQMPYTIGGTTVWSPATLNAIEAVIEQRSLT